MNENEHSQLPQIELHLLNTRLRIFSIRKNAIHKLMYPLVKLAFTKKTSCKFFSFTETNEDYSVVVDHQGYEELKPYLSIDNESDVLVSEHMYVPMYLCGDDLPQSISISKITRYLIIPLAECRISIMAISMYQCDYILVRKMRVLIFSFFYLIFHILTNRNFNLFLYLYLSFKKKTTTLLLIVFASIYQKFMMNLFSQIMRLFSWVANVFILALVRQAYPLLQPILHVPVALHA
jgi:hypothetical protein